MTSIIAREMSITYNSYKVGGDQANRILNDIHTLTMDNEKGVLEFTFTIRHDSVSAFKNEIAAAEAAYRKSFMDTKVTQGGQNFADWAQSTSFGYNAKAQIVKYGDRDDGGFARWYRVRIEVGLPADVNATSYGRNRSISVAYSPSRRRTVTISGTYTANGSTASRAQYQAVFDTYATSVLNALGGTYKKLEEPQGTVDENDKEIQFSVTYEEIIYTRVGASDASLRGEQLTVTKSDQSPGDSPDGGSTVERFIRLTAVYEAWFDNTVSVDLIGKWEGLRGAVAAEIGRVLTGGSLAITGEIPSYDWSNNKINVTIEAVGSTTNGVLEYREVVTNDIFFGPQLVGVTDGNPFSKFKYIGPGKWQRTITQEFTSMRGPDPVLFSPNAEDPPNGFEAVLISLHRDVSPVRWGLLSFPQRIDARKVTNVRIFEFYQKPITQTASVGAGGGGGGGGGSSPGGLTGGRPGDAGSTPGGDTSSSPGGGGGAFTGEPGTDPTNGFPPGFFEDNGGIPGIGAGVGEIPRPGQGNFF